MTLTPILAMRRLTSNLAALLFFSVPSFAQLHTVVGPPSVPLGANLSVTFANDNPGKFGVTTNLWRILDGLGNVVYAPTGATVSILMGSGGWYTFYWDLLDSSGVPVVPGSYTLEVKSDFGAPIASYPFAVVATGAGLVFEGTATIQAPFGGGPGRHFYLASPSDPGLPYLLLASTTTSVGTPTCGGTLPLDATPLLTLSLTPGLIFQNSFGVLDSFGASLAPRFDLPSLPSLVGIGLEAAFVVLDPAAPCLVRRISNAHALLIHG